MSFCVVDLCFPSASSDRRDKLGKLFAPTMSAVADVLTLPSPTLDPGVPRDSCRHLLPWLTLPAVSIMLTALVNLSLATICGPQSKLCRATNVGTCWTLTSRGLCSVPTSAKEHKMNVSIASVN